MLSRSFKIRWIWIIGFLFIVLNSIAIFAEFYFFALLPVVALIVYWALMRMDYLLMLIVACVPISLNLEQLELGGVGFYLPTEPLLFGVLVIFILKLVSGKSIDKRIFRHPISYIVYVYLGWMAFTTISSEFPIVSLKFLIAKMWFIGAFFFLLTHIFKDQKNMRKFLLAYLFPLFGIIIYTVVRHAGYGFEKDPGHWVMEPFYKDHTSYGAVLAMYVPIIIGLLFQKRLSPLLRALLIGGAFIIGVGLILSYTRAAWISVAGIAVVLGFMILRVKLRTLLLAFGALAAFVWVAQDDLLITLERNKQDSSDNLGEHVESISNVSSDASNLERLNRWNCAMLMFEERPILGWGPGTYQFVYAPFQKSQDLTIISTNNADKGNAHSEYLGPLAEQGILGSIIFIVLVLVVTQLSFKLAYNLTDPALRITVISCFLGLLTYFTHGFLNNFLDTDKASAPFWGFIAIIVAIDIFHKKDQDLLKTTA